MLNNYGETGSGFNNNHGQTSRPAETQKQQNIGSTWGYNSQLDGMYYGGEHQPMFMGHYEGSTKHSNYPQYPSGTIHQPVPTPVVKCHEACCQHFPDRYPLNPAPLRYQPTGPVQPRYTDLSNNDSRQYFTDRRSMQQSLSRKKMYPAENGYPPISDRHFSQYMGRGQLHMPDTRQQMQMMRSQYPMYPPYWGSTRGWPSPRMNCPPPPYHQSVNQGSQLQSGLKMSDGSHYMDPPPQKSIGSQHRRGMSAGSGGTEIIRPVPETKRAALDPNIPSCYEFGYPTGFVPFSEVNKIQGGSLTSQGSNSTCKIPGDKQYHPHQMQYSLQSNERNMMNCTNTIGDLGYPMNFPMATSEPYMRPGLDDGQTMSDGRKMSLQYDSSLGKKRPELDLRQYLATWEDDEDENTRITEPLAIGNSGAPYIVVDCRSLEGEAAGKIQDRFKTTSSQACSSKSRNSSPNTECKGMEEQSRPDGNSERTGLPPDFQTQTSSAPSMPTLMTDSDKSIWNGINRDGDGIIGKGGAFQPLDCSKRDGNIDSNLLSKRDTLPHNDMNAHKIPGTNESANMSLDALVSYYGDNRRMSDGGYDFVEMTERLVNNTDKSLGNRSVLDHQVPTEITRPCDPRLQQSQFGNNPSIYNKMAPRYPSNNYQHFKPSMPADPYYNYKHTIGPNKYFGYDGSQVIDQNYDYPKLTSEFDNARLYGNKDISKDPRRLFHQEGDKAMENTFLDPLRKGQIADCFPDKSSLEFSSVDPENFISPIVVKKPEVDNRDRHYAEKNSAIRKRMNDINVQNQSHQEKTVLITSENGPPEIFRVPYSPEKEISRKDNVVTLHSGDQSKSNTITVEVPYVQQYSTLVKLSEEISRTENCSEKLQNTTVEPISSKKSSNEEFKKPTSFKLKRLPNSKEWTVEGSEFNKTNKKDTTEATSTNTDSTANEESDSIKPVAVSNLNMPSLDDIRDGDENCDSIDQNQSSVSSNNTSCVGDEPVKNKHSSQTPQMAIVQPMKLNTSGNESLESNMTNNIDGGKCQNSLGKPEDNNFDSDKIVTDHSSNLNLVSGSDSSKHDTFRTHKKIQSSFSSTLQSCLSSPGEDFLHSQDLNAGNSKEPYSPFHVYSDCDMNSQITDYFKIDDGSVTGEKLLDTRMPSSPGVEGMFEDINSTSQNQLYQPKACNFQDLTGANMTSVSSHNPHFQSFSSIFSDDGDKRARSDGSILQMSDKKYIKQIFGDIDNDQHLKPIEDERMEIESSSTKENSQEKSESKRSPPIPTISLKLNESKKIWCIAKKDQCSDQSNSPKGNLISDLVVTSTQSMESSSFDTVNDLSVYSEEVIKDISSGDKFNCLNYKTNESNRNQCLSIEDNKNVEIYINSKMSVENSSCALLPNKIRSENNFGYQKCLSIVKYYPKMKIIRKIASYHSATDSKFETLIFDTNGTHFPKVTDVNESKFVVKAIIEEIISNAIGQTQVMDIHDIVNTEITQINNTDVDTNYQGAVKSVIIYDRTGSKNKDFSPPEFNVISTTKMFIQSEKEAGKYQHSSVIKCTVQEDYIPLNKTIRSIFSPRPEDLCEKEIISKADDSVRLAVVINPASSSDLDNLLVKSPFEIHESQSTESKENSIENGINSCNIHNSKKHIKVITVDDNNEEFRGFSSPKPNSPATCGPCNIQGEIIKDDAHKEGAGLLNISTCKEDQNTEVIVIQNDDKYERSEVHVQQQKSVSNREENVLPEKICQQGNTEPLLMNCQNMNIFKTGVDTEAKVTTVDSDDKMGIDYTNHSEIEVNKSIFIDEIDDPSKLLSSNLTPENEICKNIKVGETTDSVERTDSVTLSPVTFPTKICSIEEIPDETSQVTPFDISKPHVPLLSSKVFEERTFNEQCIKPIEINETLKNVPSNVICNNHIDSQIVNNNVSKDSENSKDKECSEDIEARLETSVIVRNNTCNSVICNTSSDTPMSSIEKEPISPRDDDMLVNKILESTTEVPARGNIPYLTNMEGQQTNMSSQELLETSSNKIEIVETTLEKPSLNLLDETSLELPNLLQNTITNINYDKSNTEVNNYESQQSDIKNFKVNSINHCSDLILKSCSDQDILTNELAQPFYCVGESFFLLNDELKKCLKGSNYSYFFNFKKMKWHKYSKIYNKKAKVSTVASSENQMYVTYQSSNTESFENNQKTINNDDLNLADCLHGDSNTLDPTPEIEKDHQIQYKEEEKLPIVKKICGGEIYLQCGEEEKLPSEELANSEEQLLHYEEKEKLPSQELSHAESEFQLKELNVYNTCCEPLTTENENKNASLSKDLSLPLKDKLQFFMTQEVKGCHIRRDSLKILEPEAVLKEIFSPDPEVENSESKENECPDHFSLEKRDLSHQLDSVKTISNIASNLPNVYNEKLRFDNFPLIENENRDLSNTSNTDDDNLLNECQVNNHPVHAAISDKKEEHLDINLKRAFDLGEPLSSVEDFRDIDALDEDHHNTEASFSPQESNLSSKKSPETSKNITLKIHTTPNPHIEGNFLSQELQNEKVGGTAYMSKPKDHCCTDSNPSDQNKEDASHSSVDNNNTVSKNNQSPFLEVNENLESTTLRSNSLSLKDTCDKELTALNCSERNIGSIQTNLHLNDSSSLNVQSNHLQTHDKRERRDSLSSLSEKNSVHCDNDDIDLQHNTYLEKELPNTVEDSLANNQNLNKETFPLQCLVEAALALENGESKQTLLDKTNFNTIYTMNNTTKSDANLKENLLEECSKNSPTTTVNDKTSTESPLTVTDKEIFSKFEENNYNLRASTRIVTSSSSNIIPYSKRKYGMKSKIPGTQLENKRKKSEPLASEKNRAKKRRGGFTYPRSKRRKKCTKDKKLCEELEFHQIDSEENLNDNVEFDVFQPDFGKTSLVNSNEILESDDLHFDKSLEINSNIESIDGVSKHDFGGPLLIANENTSAEGNIFCVHVNSDKMDEYVNHLNLGEIEVLSDNNQAVFKDSSDISSNSEVPNVTLENGTSLVIIIEDLDTDIDKEHYNKRLKGESDIILGSIEEDRSPCLTQSNSMLDDCSNMLTSEFSVNESCICPPQFEINGNENNLLKDKNGDQILETDSFLSKTAYEINDNIEDIYGKYSVNCNQELLTTNCYEEINENLVNDIGNWPFVEEEVAEFDNKPELPNAIPEVGRKIELKCSLPWKKIFNISKQKNKKKKNKASKKISGLELGPANVEVRLKAPSAEWKVISDYHENSSPVVKVSRLILQRDSDNSSYSEKDSEEENENRRKLSESSLNLNPLDKHFNNPDVKSITENENWQPVVLLTRNKELDELTLSLDLKIPEKIMPSCISTSSCDQKATTEINSTHSSIAESEESENDNVDLSESTNSDSSESSQSSKTSECTSKVSSPEEFSEYKSCANEKTEKVVYELYSPSGCNNESSNLNIYSPSDPHFSPNNEYVESEFNHEIPQDEITSSEEKLDQNQDVYNANNKIDTNDQDTISQSTEINLNHSYATINNELSKVSDSYEQCNNDSPGSTSESKVENENSSQSRTSNDENYSRDKNTNESSYTMHSNENLTEGLSLERKSKPKRKMPKNFFVRKKLRRPKDNDKTNDEKLIFGEESDTTKSSVESPASNLLKSRKSSLDNDKNSSCLFDSSQSESQSGLSSSLTEQLNNSESDISVSSENSRLYNVSETETSSPAQLNEYYIAERIEVNQRVRDAGRGIKRPCEGHSKQDTKRRRKKLRSHFSRCEECNLQFDYKEELTRHNAYRHTRHRELHHCMLCQRSFSSAARHSLHTQGRSHRHLELSQRHAIHAVHSLLVGGPCPRLPPLSPGEHQAIQWRPSQPGYTHVYHGHTPLQLALQEHSSSTLGAATSEDAATND